VLSPRFVSILFILSFLFLFKETKMSSLKLQLKSVIKFLLKEDCISKNIHERMVAVYGENCPSYFQVKNSSSSLNGAGIPFMLTHSVKDLWKHKLSRSSTKLSKNFSYCQRNRNIRNKCI
jgi:hypothetical protein